MDDLTPIADGLQFPEGPVALPDGSLLVCEIARGTLSRITPAGTVEVVADCGGGPNGAAMGPDGKVYLCNNGAYFTWQDMGGATIPVHGAPGHEGGSIQRVDLDTGEVETLHTECDGRRLVAPNDLVFDASGGIWFTDHGVLRGEHDDHPGLLYAPADGGPVVGAAWGLDASNGVGLSPDGTTVYVAETHDGRVWAFEVTAPGQVADGGAPGRPHAGRLHHDAPEGTLYDSLAVDGEGWVCVASIGPGGIDAISPDGQVEHIEADDLLTTNICFAGDDLRTAYLTLSSSGRVVSRPWPRPGLRLAF